MQQPTKKLMKMQTPDLEGRDKEYAGERVPLMTRIPSSRETTSNEGSEASTTQQKYPSLDFDRIVNGYSIAAATARNKHVFQQRIRKHSRHNGKDTLHGRSSSTVERTEQVMLSNRGFVVARWYLTMLVGISTGLTAAFVLYFVEKLIEFRVGRLNRELQFLKDPDFAEIEWYDSAVRALGTPGVYLGYMFFNLLLVSVSTFLCETLAPGAVSSGIPEVMSYLNGVQVGDFDSLKLFVVKLICTIFSVSSGLVIGPEGPVVHIGSILGACVTRLGDLEWALRQFRGRHPQLAKSCGCADLKAATIQSTDGDSPREEQQSEKPKFRQTWISNITFCLSHFRNDLERRNLISVGAAAGFASAFGAPVGGLLYSLEEASSFFDHAMLWKTLLGTCLATSIIAIYHGDFTKYSMLSLEIGAQEENLLARFSEVPLYIVMGILGGVLGGTFNNVYYFINRKRRDFYRKLARKSKKRRRYIACKLFESGLVSLITSAIMLTAPLQAQWACKAGPEFAQDLSTGQAYVHQYNCPKGYANEMGSILFGSREASIRDILTDPETFDPETLLTVGLIFLGLMIITFGTSVPSGMFMPTVLTGACLGGYLGMEFQRHVISSVHPSDFALIGAAAFLSGMQRNVVSLCVILMEGTGQTKVIIPIIITIVCARSVGDLFSDGIYEIGIELKEYPYLHHGEKFMYDSFRAADVMKKDVNCLKLLETAGSLQSLLRVSKEQAFPVVSDGEGHYLGTIRRDQLIAALQCRIYLESYAEDQYTSSSSSSSDYEEGVSETVSPWLRDNICVEKTSTGTKLLYGVDETLPEGSTEIGARHILKKVRRKQIVHIPDEEKSKVIDIGSLMNKAVFSVAAETPLSKAFNVFSTLGLRHLPVLTPGGQVAGMITREELSEEHITAMMGQKLKA